MKCSDYDYLELACVYGFELTLSLVDGQEVTGKAITIGINQARQECLELLVDDVKQWVVLTTISKLEVLTPNPHFRTKTFHPQVN